MGTKTTISEHELLLAAENDIVQYGKTEIKCPRCGNEIIIEDKGSSYSVRCKTKNCISDDYRGI